MWLEVGILILLVVLYRSMFGTKKFHVEVEKPKIMAKGFNILPVIQLVLSILPNSIKRNGLVKGGAPKPGSQPRDTFDCNKEDPYAIEEIVPNKVWKVQHSSENALWTTEDGRKGAKVLGMDPFSEDFERKMLIGAAKFSKQALEMVSTDLETARYWLSKETIEDEDLFKIPANNLNMMVVKLDNGSLLIYAPTRIRDETGFGAWLDNLGKVEWIVIGSSEHNLNIPAALKRYPNAKVIGSAVSEMKLEYVGALKNNRLDYVYSDEKSLVAVNKILKPNGVELFYIAGDIATHSVFCLAHGTAFECDLIYGTHGMENGKTLPETWPHRIFKFGLMSTSPNGFLPNYRFWFMDPNALGSLMITPPKKDGSTCKELARSLRKILALNFDRVIGVHASIIETEDFKKSVNSSWNWLDGASLIS